MKKLSIILATLLFAALTITSCSKKSNDKNEEIIALSSWESTDDDAIKYDSKTDSISINGATYIQFPLKKEISSGESVKINLYGTNKGDSGFRSWLVDKSQITNSNLYLDSTFQNLPQGNFELSYKLTAIDSSTYLFIKGPQWGQTIEGITITKIKVEY